jgi:hypothetical protein
MILSLLSLKAFYPLRKTRKRLKMERRRRGSCGLESSGEQDIALGFRGAAGWFYSYSHGLGSIKRSLDRHSVEERTGPPEYRD